MKRILAFLMIITLFTSLVLVSTAESSLGQTIASCIFDAEDDNGNPLYSDADKTMFIELIQLFKDVNDADGMAEAYEAAFESLAPGQQDRVSNFGGTIDVAYGFAEFLEDETDSQQAIDNMKKYLLENDEDAFAAAIDRRESGFIAAMDNDISKVQTGLKNLPRLFDYLMLSKTWKTEILIYNTSTREMRLNRENATKAIQSANSILQNDITDIDSVLTAMEEIPEYFNNADSSDKSKIRTYLNKYGFIKLESPSTPSDDGGDTGGGSGTVVTPTPTPIVTPTPTAAPTPTQAPAKEGEPVTIGVQVEEKDGVVTGSITLEDLKTAPAAQAGASVVLSAKTESGKATQVSLNIDMPVITGFNDQKVESVVISTDVGHVELKPAVLIDTLAKAIPTGNVEDITSVNLSLNALTPDQAVNADMTEEQKAAISAIPEGSTIYNINLSYTRKAGDETVTESLTSDHVFAEPVLIQLPYTPKEGEDLNSIIVHYIDAEGNLQNVGGVYDEKTGTVRCLLVHFSYYMIGTFSMDFPDLDSTHWAYNDVKKLVANQVINGMPDGSFKPADSVTRAEFVKMATVILKYQLNKDYEVSFTDVAETDWFANYAKMATEKGLVKGYPDNKFMPNNKITRQEIVTIIARALGNKAVPSTFEDLTYKDKDKIADYAKEAVAVCRSSGILVEMENFNPTADTTRAEAAVMLYRLYEILLNLK